MEESNTSHFCVLDSNSDIPSQNNWHLTVSNFAGLSSIENTREGYQN